MHVSSGSSLWRAAPDVTAACHCSSLPRSTLVLPPTAACLQRVSTAAPESRHHNPKAHWSDAEPAQQQWEEPQPSSHSSSTLTGQHLHAMQWLTTTREGSSCVSGPVCSRAACVNFLGMGCSSSDIRTAELMLHHGV